MKKLFAAALMVLTLTLGCAITPPTGLKFQHTSVYPDVIAEMKASTYPNLQVIYAVEDTVPDGRRIRLEILDFDGNGICDQMPPGQRWDDGGILYRQDDGKWTVITVFNCDQAAEAKAVILNKRANKGA